MTKVTTILFGMVQCIVTTLLYSLHTLYALHLKCRCPRESNMDKLFLGFIFFSPKRWHTCRRERYNLKWWTKSKSKSGKVKKVRSVAWVKLSFILSGMWWKVYSYSNHVNFGFGIRNVPVYMSINQPKPRCVCLSI